MTQNSIKSILSTWSQKCDILDIELIIAHVINRDRVFIMTHPEYTLTKNHQEQVSLLCKKRAENYPLAYILEHKEFYGRNFIINEHTLVPRPETEILIEKTIHFILKKKLTNILIIDIGTGSGIIAITLAKKLEDKDVKIKILASDISIKALKISKQNAQLHQANITFYHSDLLNNKSLQNNILQADYKNIIVVSNLPYVDIERKSFLLEQPESSALRFEPPDALWSHEGGLSHYKKLINQTIAITLNDNFKNTNITSFYEIDPEQSDLLTKYLHSKLPDNSSIEYFKDLSAKDRIIKWSL